MSFSYVLTPEATAEYIDAFTWYIDRSLKAADGFVLAVKNAIRAACDNPKRYRNSYKDFRELNLKGFPFHLIYYIDQDRELIVIVSIFHHKRDPQQKYPSE